MDKKKKLQKKMNLFTGCQHRYKTCSSYLNLQSDSLYQLLHNGKKRRKK